MGVYNQIQRVTIELEKKCLRNATWTSCTVNFLRNENRKDRVPLSLMRAEFPFRNVQSVVKLEITDKQDKG